MTDEAGYNGWANYATWSVALILDNDERLYNERREVARSAAEQGRAERPDHFTEEESIRFHVADQLKEWVTDSVPEFDEQPYGPLCYLWSQLLGAALSEVNWFELADNYIDELEEAEADA
jgi:hypothetical protein